ncbi:MAG: D-alanine--D-alanine ligase family protein [Candidatus Tectimicrobiota bacterium]
MAVKTSSKIRLAVLYGGRSGEHDVSIASAASVLQAIDRHRYDVLAVYITSEGRWLLDVEPAPLLQGLAPPSTAPVAMLSSDPQHQVFLTGLSPHEWSTAGARPVDVVFPLLHGPYGEDGTVQGLIELAGLPYVGSGVLGSAVGMDKGVMKVLLQAAGLPVVPYVVLRRRDWEEQPTAVQTHLLNTLPCPLFVKPANLGSSVGISKVKHPDELAAALELACQFDRRLVVEQGVDCRELECSVLGNDVPEVSVVGEIVPCREFYDYEAKYGAQPSELHIPASLEASLAAQIRHMAGTAFQAVEAAGLARVDFFVERHTGQLYVNEINTLPGFTTVSMYPKLWAASGVSYSQLIDRLVHLAFERHHERQRSRTTYR